MGRSVRKQSKKFARGARVDVQPVCVQIVVEQVGITVEVSAAEASRASGGRPSRSPSTHGERGRRVPQLMRGQSRLTNRRGGLVEPVVARAAVTQQRWVQPCPRVHQRLSA